MLARAWEFMLGALLATGVIPKIAKRDVGDAVALAGLGLLAALYLRLHPSPMPGVLALGPCLASVLILYGCDVERSRIARLMSWRPMAALGRASYSIYLWHWPLMAFATYYVFEPAHAVLVGRLVLLAAIPIGLLSMRYVEAPFRAPREILKGKAVFLTVGGLSAVLVIYGVTLSLTQGFPARFGPVVEQLNVRDAQLHYRCADRPLEGLATDRACRLGDPSAPATFALWGDSHGAMYRDVIDRAAGEHHLAGYDLTAKGCAPVPAPRPGNDRLARCGHRSEAALVALERLKPRVVIISTALALHIGPPDHPTAGEMTREFEGVIERLVRNGAKVYFMEDTPEIGDASPEKAARRIVRGASPPLLPRRQDYDRQRAKTLGVVGPLLRRGLIELVEVKHVYCPAETCRTGDEAGPFYIDDNHLTGHGAEQAAPVFQALFARLGGAGGR